MLNAKIISEQINTKFLLLAKFFPKFHVWLKYDDKTFIKLLEIANTSFD